MIPADTCGHYDPDHCKCTIGRSAPGDCQHGCRAYTEAPIEWDIKVVLKGEENEDYYGFDCAPV